MTTHRLTVRAAALAAALALSACGSNDTATGTTPASAPASAAPSAGHGSGHGTGTSSAPAPPAAAADDADIRFLTGMRPHHEQAVEMSEIVLAAEPPAAVAALARRVKGAQDPEIEEMDTMLADLGQPADAAAHGGAHATGHGGMMSEADMAALRDAQGDEAARRYLEGMVAHHEGAIEAAEAQLRDGRYEPARQLASRIAEDQAAEIAEIERLLASL